MKRIQTATLHRAVTHVCVLGVAVLGVALAGPRLAIVPGALTAAAVSNEAGGRNEVSLVVLRSQNLRATASPASSVSAKRLHLAWPLGGTLTQPFGASPYPFEPSVTVGSLRVAHFHTGIDIAAPAGTNVAAAADGAVEYAGGYGSYGQVVVMRHDEGIRTLYGHLGQTLVRTGQQVAAGTTLGHEGSTGNSTGPHLHFEVRPSPLVVGDPAQYLGPDDASTGGRANVTWGTSPGADGASPLKQIAPVRQVAPLCIGQRMRWRRNGC